MEIYSEEHVVYTDEDGGCIINASDQIVLLCKPDSIDLKSLWDDFSQTLRSELGTLMKMRYGDVEARYGELGLTPSSRENSRNTPYGFVRDGTTIRLRLLEKKPVIQELVNLGLLPAKTPHGRSRQNTPRGGIELPSLLEA